MVEIWLRYGWDMVEIWLRYGWNMVENDWDMVEIWLIYICWPILSLLCMFGKNLTDWVTEWVKDWLLERLSSLKIVKEINDRIQEWPFISIDSEGGGIWHQLSYNSPDGFKVLIFGPGFFPDEIKDIMENKYVWIIGKDVHTEILLYTCIHAYLHTIFAWGMAEICELRLRYGRDIEEIWFRYGWDLAEMRLRHHLEMVEIWLR